MAINKIQYLNVLCMKSLSLQEYAIVEVHRIVETFAYSEIMQKIY